MAQVVGEKKDKLTPAAKGEEVTELKFRGTFNGEDCHYPHEMISGAKMMERCIDCCTELSNIRDKGDGGLWVASEVACVYPMNMLDAYEIYVWLIKQGNSSRRYGYEMWKTSE